METSLAQGDAFGAGLQAGFALGLEVDDVVHLGHFNADSRKPGFIGLELNLLLCNIDRPDPVFSRTVFTDGADRTTP